MQVRILPHLPNGVTNRRTTIARRTVQLLDSRERPALFFKTNYYEILFSIFSNTCGSGNHGNWRPLFKLRTILFRMDKLLCMVFSFRIF